MPTMEYEKMLASEDPAFVRMIVTRLKALADETRVRIILRLKQGDANVTTLVEEVGVPQASVSKHLAVLRAVGIVDGERQGNQVVYRLTDDSIESFCKIVCEGTIAHVRRQQEAMSSMVASPAARGRGVPRVR